MAFVLNNIRFRSVSSKSLEKYYNSKSHILDQLINDKNQFSQVAREILLLFFNSYSDWASRVEYLLLNRSTVEDADVQIIFQRFGEIVESNKQIFSIHGDVFLPAFMNVWGKVHRHIPLNFKRKVRQTKGLSQLEAYPLIIDALVRALESTLFELYEIDCLLGSNLVRKKVTSNASNVDRLVTYVDNDDLMYFRDKGVFVIKERINLYLSTLILPDIILPVVVKNYSDDEVTLNNGVIIGDQPLAGLLEDLQKNPRVKIEEVVST